MSDDLISQKDAIAIIENMIFEVGKDLSKSYLLQDARERIIRLNAAFDKEKVIEKLKDQYNYSRKVRNKNDNDYFEYWDGRTDSYKDAIEIVEKGGLE